MESTEKTKFGNGLKDRKQAADFLNVSVITVDRNVKNKKLGCYRVGTRVLFDVNEHLQPFLKRCEQQAK